MRVMLLWIKWLLLLPFFLVGSVIKYPLPWLVVPLFSTTDKLHLRPPFEWFDTIDNPLTGDAGWQREHLWYGTDPMHVLNRIGWLVRNGGNRMNYTLFGCDSDDPHPFWRPYLPIGFGYRWDVMLGWNMHGIQAGRAKYCCIFLRFKKGDRVMFDESLLD